jgi:PilZ domain
MRTTPERRPMDKVIPMTGRSLAGASRLSGLRDRRYTIRYPFAADAELIEMETGKQVTGVTSDVSLGGCFICTSKSLPSNSRARLRLTRKDQVLDTLVTVRIVKPRIGLGVEFFDLEPPNDRVLANWIESLQRR